MEQYDNDNKHVYTDINRGLVSTVFLVVLFLVSCFLHTRD